MNSCNNCNKLSACEDAVCDKTRVNCPFFKNLLNIVYEDDDSHYVVNGEAFYSVVNGEIVLQRVTDESYAYEVHHLIDGEEFPSSVEFGSFCLEPDAHCGVIVDGYHTNISFSYSESPYELRPGCQHPGESLVCFGDSLWEKLCSEHVVKVNAEGTWAMDDVVRRQVVKGKAFYSVVNGEIVLQRTTDERYFYEVYDLIDGGLFLMYDQEGYWEGTLCGVLVDGYVSNIGLCTNCGIPYQTQPDYENPEEFRIVLGDSLWEKLCREHIVKVNWANK